jgi:hypothetical protein
MRKTMLLAVMLALTVLVMAAAPAIARDNHNNNRHNDKNNNFFDRHHDFDHNGDHNDFFFTGISPVSDFEDVDVDVEEVGNNNDLEGECFVTDIDGNGSIDDWEVEITCFV